MSYANVLMLIGGLGFFLYGMKLMSSGMEKMAGSKMKTILSICTKNQLVGVLVGTLFTAVIQSSSAATVMVVSFVNAGFMTPVQSIGVIMGANIGTAITGQLVSFSLEEFAPIFILAGVIMYNFMKKPVVKKVGEVLLGFGILFFGIGTMKDSVSTLGESESVMSILGYLGVPLIGFLIGLIVTLILQSSSASIGILISMAAAGVFSDIDAGFYIIAGTCIGTCITAILASIGGKKDAKRVAFMNIFFNIITMAILTIIYIPLGSYWNSFIMSISTMGDASQTMARAIANDQMLLKILQVVIGFPLSKFIVRMSYVVIRGENETTEPCELKYISPSVAPSPATCILETTREINRMGQHAINNLERSFSAILKYDDDKVRQVYETEEQIDYLSKAISDYLVTISQSTMPISDGRYIAAYFHVVTDIERIGDHAENLAEFAQKKQRDDIRFSDEGVMELQMMFDKVLTDVRLSLNAFVDRDPNNLDELAMMEEEINKMEKRIQRHHIARLTKNICSPDSTIYSDIVSNLERVGDHANNIAFAIFSKYEI